MNTDTGYIDNNEIFEIFCSIGLDAFAYKTISGGQDKTSVWFYEVLAAP